jgi:hypothetical protein
MELHWKICLERQETGERVTVGAARRPVEGAAIADFGLSLAEGRQLLTALQQLVAQDQIRAYDVLRRTCRHCGRYRRIKDWRIRTFRTLTASLEVAAPSLPFFYRCCASTAYHAAIRLRSFLENNQRDLVDYQQARMEGRRVSSASAESVMNHLVNRRLSKRQQMRWSMKGAHYLLQTRVELLDGRLERCFLKRFPHFRSPETVRR